MSGEAIETDYLVIGAGASALAFVDTLVRHGDADVVMVDRRPRPGGHWQDAYPFVRLHIPSAFYGVDSRPLGNDAIAADGQYERATGAEVRDYYERFVEEDLLPTGRVRFLGGHEHPRDTQHIRVRRKVVDTTFFDTQLPATHPPAFPVDPEARFVPVHVLPEHLDAGRYLVLGSGKTAMDACAHLLEHGVAPERIRWARPRDQWLLDRAGLQPLEQVGSIAEGTSLDLEALAEARSMPDLFARLEDNGRLLRLDPGTTPTMYRCAIVTRAEADRLRRVDNVIRLGHVRSITAGEVVLDGGTVPVAEDELIVNCTANGLATAPAVPIFDHDRITLRLVRNCAPPFSAALIGYVEATRDDPAEQNRLCPAIAAPRVPDDWLRALVHNVRLPGVWYREPDLAQWVESTRLNLTRGLAAHAGEPRVQRALERISRHRAAAAANAVALLGGGSPGD